MDVKRYILNNGIDTGFMSNLDGQPVQLQDGICRGNRRFERLQASVLFPDPACLTFKQLHMPPPFRLLSQKLLAANIKDVPQPFSDQIQGNDDQHNRDAG